MQKIIPHLWFDKEAAEASEFYVSVFGGDSKIESTTLLRNTPSGDCDFIEFKLWGHQFMAISAGPFFKLNPSISFMLNFDPSQDPDAAVHIKEMWDKLSQGGKALMDFGEYPFSKQYGWIQDKYGVSWQLILTNPEGEKRPAIIPSLMFAGNVYGKAEEAFKKYVSIFKNAKLGMINRYPGGEPSVEGKVMFMDAMLEGQWFAAIDAAGKHDFGFNEAISLLVECETQEEIDYYWNKLSSVPEAEQCGWLKDIYGVSWQIHPRKVGDMLKDTDQEKVDRVTKAFLQMKKFDIATLQKAYEGAN